MIKNINNTDHWNRKHTQQSDIFTPYNFSQITEDSLSYNKVASDIISLSILKNVVNNKSILEIGCSGGYFCSYLKYKIVPSDWIVEGWDFSVVAIESAIRRNKDNTNIIFKEVDILTTPVENNYGFICVFETLEHFDEGKNYELLNQWLEHCEYLILSTVTTIDDCCGEHVSHYKLDTFDEKGYEVIWKDNLVKINMEAAQDLNDYYYFMVVLKGKL